MTQIPVLVILGPTAAGKTSLAVRAARQINGEIVSADSRQVFRGMTIGSGKDLADYQDSEGSIPVHLIDIRDPGYEFSVFEFRKEAEQAFSRITRSNRSIVLCGGTGLYLSSILQGYRFSEVPEDPDFRNTLENLSLEQLASRLNASRKTHNTTDLTDRSRLIRALEIDRFGGETGKNPFSPYRFLIYGLTAEREVLYSRIEKRLRFRLQNGLIEEVRGLLNAGLKPEQLRFYGLEYRFVTDYLDGQFSLAELESLLAQAIRKFAKRQLTWFRKMEKEGVSISWLTATDPEEENAARIFSGWTSFSGLKD
ncbi:MAG: tRNA (adenosine(37)-N6)-dimethylallyltransferase MiaA [Bacteroidetes bacterium]|nr:tRNA (adenosine(37)-N6)-dimethylallyltransferase MiaA [Bacteroidota bacterium]